LTTSLADFPLNLRRIVLVEKKNAENLLIIHDRKLAEKYVKNWHAHAQHLKLYVGSGVTKAGPAVQKLVQEKDEVSGPER
jgi:hypothetical protein